jgi:hypothetical protein
VRRAVRYVGQVAHEWLTMPQQAGRAVDGWLWRAATVIVAYLVVRLGLVWWRGSGA